MIIYIVLNNNGESYEDYDQWNSSVSTDFSTAVEKGMKNTAGMSSNFSIECWDTDTNTKVKEHCFERSFVSIDGCMQNSWKKDY